MAFGFLKNMLPGSIERDLLKRHTGPFVFCFFTIMFLLLMQFLIQFMDHLVGKGIPFSVILELIMVNLAYMVVLAIPMTILAASLMAYGKFSEHNEYTALRAGGVHPFRIIRPVFFSALFLTIFIGWFSNEVLPEANYKARALFIDIRMKKPGFDLQENVFYEGIDGYTFLVKKIPQESDSLYDITLFQRPEQGRDRAVIRANKGYLEGDERHMRLTLHLKEGSILRYLQRSGHRASTIHEITEFETYRITFDLSDLTFSRTNPEDRRRDGRSMSAQAMLAVVDSLKREKRKEIETFIASLEKQFISFDKRPLSDQPEHPFKKTKEDYDDRENIVSSVRLQTANNALSKPGASVDLPEGYVMLGIEPDLESQKELLKKATLKVRNTRGLSDHHINNLRWREERVARFMVEVHKKVAIPVACILFAMIGAPLGLLVKKGNMGIHALISTALFTYYWISIIQGEKMADRLIISPVTGMWFGNITIGIAGLALIIYVIRKH